MQNKAAIGLLAGLMATLFLPALLAREGERDRILFSACQEAGTMTIHASSDPPGAAVQVDGSHIGQTPAKLCLQAGRHKITLSRSGYLDDTRQVETLPGSEVLLEAELKKGLSETERERLYGKSVAVVWALAGIEDDKSCRQALDRYQRDYGSLSPRLRNVIESTYRDVMGACDTNDPLRADRDKARRYLRGMSVRW